jgi:hypothetical protein
VPGVRSPLELAVRGAVTPRPGDCVGSYV